MEPPIERLRRRRRAFRAREPTDRAAVVSAVAFDALLAAALLFAPEYLRLLGSGPIAVGLFGSAALLAVAARPAFLAAAAERVDRPSGAVGALATGGALLWLGAPQFAALTGVPAWFPLTLGLVPLALRRTGSGLLDPARSDDRPPSARALRRIALVAGLVPVAAATAWVPGFVPAFQVVLALTAAVGVVATVLETIEREGERDRRRESASPPADPPPAVDAALDAVRSIPRRARPLLFGDLLLRFAGGMVVAFLVIAVTTVLRVDATVFGHHLGAAPLYALAVAVESAVVAACAVPARRLGRYLGHGVVAASGALIASLFPVVLLSAPGDALALLAVFGGFGLRFVGVPARRTLIERAVPDRDREILPSYRLLRDLLVAPSALAGGLLYAASPTLAFGLASSVGVLGLRELLRFVAEERRR